MRSSGVTGRLCAARSGLQRGLSGGHIRRAGYDTVRQRASGPCNLAWLESEVVLRMAGAESAVLLGMIVTLKAG